ncbi:MAG: DNA lyase [Magnetococcales bacterium]|nr:DNA lyase [Magnetococcales bacterium]MBF0116548.1 DNA lyase [Magnetococcales bacterium]
MRLWTLHPRYLDAKGLVAVWREALLAQTVLRGETRGYRHHPQLLRFRAQPDPLASIAVYLHGVRLEAEKRGYCFDPTRIGRQTAIGQIEETQGQLLHEWRHLQDKLAARSPETLAMWQAITIPEAHPLFHIVPGGVQAWERGVSN